MHLTLAERKSIELALNQNASLRSVSKQLGRPLSTISREVKKHAQPISFMPYKRIKNCCIHRSTCTVTGLCKNKTGCQHKCSRCDFCNLHCPDFVEEHCPRLLSAPFVCNGCPLYTKCILHKKVYRADAAHKAYRSTLVESRSGFNLSEQELSCIDSLYSPLILQGQSVYHIAVSHKDMQICSARTVYRLVHSNSLSARNLDMPRVCRLKLRSGPPRTMKIDKSCRVGRSFTDFKQFMAEHPDSSVVQMDSVIGRIGGKVLLTLHLTSCDFMLAFLRDANTSSSVISCFDSLRSVLQDVFPSIFSVLLTDNGSEFSNPSLIERNDIHLFYCDPSSPYQKALVELNHEFIRRILPKGSSFDSLSQQDINLMFSHINSYARAKFSGKSPSQLFASIYGLDTLHLLCQEIIPREKIILNASLFKS